MNPYKELANAIIIQAANDYRSAVLKLKEKGCNGHTKADIESIEQFFRSGWYRCLTEVDGGMLLRKLKEEVQTQ